MTTPSQPPQVYVIAGPTASGKTSAGIALAKKIGGQIISADSMQVYQGMDIGTAKPTLGEMDGIIHHMLSVKSPLDPFSVKEYQQMARGIIHQLIQKNIPPIIVGGTGFYINALIYDTQFFQENNRQDMIHQKDLALRESYQQFAHTHGPQELFKVLEALDPEYAKTLHPNNVKKVIRAIGYCQSTGQLFSTYNQQQRQKKCMYPTHFTLLTMAREELYRRIDQRVDAMWDLGLVDEVKNLLRLGCQPDSSAMQGIGYKEVIPYIHGQITKEETIARIQQASRNYAKRQVTWFKHQLSKDQMVTQIDVTHKTEREILCFMNI